MLEIGTCKLVYEFHTPTTERVEFGFTSSCKHMVIGQSNNDNSNLKDTCFKFHQLDYHFVTRAKRAVGEARKDGFKFWDKYPIQLESDQGLTFEELRLKKTQDEQRKKKEIALKKE